ATRDGMALIRRRLDPANHPLERMTAAEVVAARAEPGAAALLRAGLPDAPPLFVAACASGLADLKDTASVPALTAVYLARALEADADVRITIRDALRALAGHRLLDSLERVTAASAKARAPASYPPDFARPPEVHGARLHTTAGDIEWEFFPTDAPQTVKNFVRLAERGDFDGTVIHRVVPHFVVPDGD